MVSVVVRVTSSGTISFQSPVDYSVEGGYVITADLDGDGKIDIAVSGQTGFVRVLYGHGDGTFDAAVSYHREPPVMRDYFSGC